jgi:hypothetical protein
MPAMDMIQMKKTVIYFFDMRLLKNNGIRLNLIQKSANVPFWVQK